MWLQNFWKAVCSCSTPLHNGYLKTNFWVSNVPVAHNFTHKSRSGILRDDSVLHYFVKLFMVATCKSRSIIFSVITILLSVYKKGSLGIIIAVARIRSQKGYNLECWHWQLLVMDTSVILALYWNMCDIYMCVITLVAVGTRLLPLECAKFCD